MNKLSRERATLNLERFTHYFLSFRSFTAARRHLKCPKDNSSSGWCSSSPLLSLCSLLQLWHQEREIKMINSWGSKRVNYTLDSSSLSTHIICSRSEICLLSSRSVHALAPSRHLPKQWQLTQAQNILTGMDPAWLQQRGSTELSCRRRKRAGLHGDGKTKNLRGPRKERSNRCRASNKTQLC